MTKVQQIYDSLREIAPLEAAKPGDRVGFLVGHASQDVAKALFALDITDEVIDEAVELGAGLIVSHHPVFFTLEDVTDATRDGATVLRLAQEWIAAICMHTNLDAAEGGVNDSLAVALGLREITRFCADGCGRAGLLDVPMDVQAFAARCKTALGSGVIRFNGSGRPVKHVCVASGSGFSSFAEARAWGVDTFVCGEAKHSAFLDAAHAGINLLECGHHATEVVVFQNMIPVLKGRFPEIEFVLSERQGEPYDCL